MKRRSSAEIAELCEKADQDIRNGALIKTACSNAGVADQVYRRWKKASPKLAVTKKPRRLLNVQDLPMVAMDTEKLFMVYGSPSLLASFAKGLQ